MAKNTGNNRRNGAVKQRSQIQHPKNPELFIKRNKITGKFESVKKGLYKGVTKEVGIKTN